MIQLNSLFSVLGSLVLMFFLTACSATSNDGGQVPPQTANSTTGPFVVEFSADAKTYQHNMTVTIDDTAGGVQYLLTTAAAEDVVFISTDLKVTGCAPSQVKHNVFWLPTGDPSYAIPLSPGSTFRTRAGIQGIFLHSLAGLDGCASVNLTTILKLKEKTVTPAPKCKESSEASCQVQVACVDSKGSDRYVEVEVWKESWGTTLRKFTLASNGTRTLAAMNSVTGTQSGSIWNFKTDRDLTSLRLDTVAKTGLYNLAAAGQVFPTELFCESYL